MQKLLKLISKAMNPLLRFVRLRNDARIWLNDYVKQNYCCFGAKKAHLKVINNLYAYKNNSWPWFTVANVNFEYENCSIAASCCFNAERHRNRIDEFFWREVICHLFCGKITFLEENFNVHVISKSAYMALAQRSCDVTTLDFPLRSYAGALAYVNKPQILNDFIRQDYSCYWLVSQAWIFAEVQRRLFTCSHF